MKNNNILPSVIIDCSHGNSQKDVHNQKTVLLHSLHLRYGDKPLFAIRGCMLESFLKIGCTDIALCHEPENYGTSITDPCLSWNMTELLLEEAATFVRKSKVNN